MHRKLMLLSIYTLLFLSLLQFCTTFGINNRKCSAKVSRISINMANPVTSDGSNYGKFTNEEDAFLWFDEALFYVRAGSGGAGSNAVKFGTGRQHKFPTGGNGGNGGNVYLVADSNVNTLLHFRGASHFRAEVCS